MVRQAAGTGVRMDDDGREWTTMVSIVVHSRPFDTYKSLKNGL